MASRVLSVFRTFAVRTAFKPITFSAIRTFSAASEAASTLKTLLEAEFKHEQKEAVPLDKSVIADLSANFTIGDEKGKNFITLTRKDTSNETVVVSIDAGNPQYSDDGGEPEEGEQEGEAPEPETLFYGTVSVQKPGKDFKLVVECFFGGSTGVDIRNVHYVPVDTPTEDLGSKTYSGPIYDELDDEVKSGFDSYVASLGVDFEFATAVFQLADDKERREYTGWLKNVATYLK